MFYLTKNKEHQHNSFNVAPDNHLPPVLLGCSASVCGFGRISVRRSHGFPDCLKLRQEPVYFCLSLLYSISLESRHVWPTWLSLSFLSLLFNHCFLSWRSLLNSISQMSDVLPLLIFSLCSLCLWFFFMPSNGIFSPSYQPLVLVFSSSFHRLTLKYIHTTVYMR